MSNQQFYTDIPIYCGECECAMLNTGRKVAYKNTFVCLTENCPNENIVYEMKLALEMEDTGFRFEADK